MTAASPDWALDALSAARVVFYSIDCGAGSVTLSESIGEMLGLAPRSRERAWRSVILPEDRSLYEAARRKLSPMAPSFETEYRVRHARAARQFLVLDRATGDFDGKGRLLCIHGFIIDVLARVGAEREAKLRPVAFEVARMAA